MKTQQQIDASKKISEILGKIELLYQEAAQVADEAGVDFYWEGPAGTYGAGGYYAPKPAQEAAKANAKQVSEQREAIEKIDKYLATAKQALIDASEVAREAGIEFNFRYAKWRTTDFQRSLAVV